ncbi:hypothetical protein V8J88_08240 [Massilia sp. W12]|uniref:hypothetical protein n=1 Tax=Massilia sp. W12 TaxID=3126507 RepID=UPI0030CD9CD4
MKQYSAILLQVWAARKKSILLGVMLLAALCIPVFSITYGFKEGLHITALLMLCIVMPFLSLCYWIYLIIQLHQQNNPIAACLLPGLNPAVRRVALLGFITLQLPCVLLLSAAIGSFMHAMLCIAAIFLMILAVPAAFTSKWLTGFILTLALLNFLGKIKIQMLIDFVSALPQTATNIALGLGIILLCAILLIWHQFPRGGMHHYSLVRIIQNFKKDIEGMKAGPKKWENRQVYFDLDTPQTAGFKRQLQSKHFANRMCAGLPPEINWLQTAFYLCLGVVADILHYFYTGQAGLIGFTMSFSLLLPTAYIVRFLGSLDASREEQKFFHLLPGANNNIKAELAHYGMRGFVSIWLCSLVIGLLVMEKSSLLFFAMMQMHWFSLYHFWRNTGPGFVGKVLIGLQPLILCLLFYLLHLYLADENLSISLMIMIGLLLGGLRYWWGRRQFASGARV